PPDDETSRGPKDCRSPVTSVHGSEGSPRGSHLPDGTRRGERRSFAPGWEQLSVARPLPGLGHQQPEQDESGGADAGQAQERHAAAETIADQSGQRRAEGRADSAPGAAAPSPKVESAGGAGSTDDRERAQQSEDGSTDSVEQLHGD